jgi:hypothetical protein
MKPALFARGLCAAALLLNLAACGGGGGSDAAGPSATPTALVATPAQANGPADGNVPTPSLRCAP